MEPLDLPEPDAEDPLRAIVLTPASQNTAARSSVAEGGFSDRSKGFTILVIMAAIFVSAVWPAAILAFLGALLGFQGVIALGPEWWILIAAGALFPLPIIWLAVLTWSKARELSREAQRLALVADRLIEPDQTAVHEIATVGMAIRREVDSLFTGVEAALEKVRSLEGAVAAQAMAIEDAASGAEKRAEQVRARMETERRALGDVVTSLQDLTTQHSQEIQKHTAGIEAVATKARSALDETTRHLDRQGQVLTQAVGAAVTDSQKVTESIQLQVTELTSASDKALAITDELTSRYGSHLVNLQKTAQGLGLENNRLETTLNRQRELLAGVSELITNQNGQILSAIDGGVSHLDEALKQTVVTARKAAEGFRLDIDQISVGASEAVSNISKAAEKASFAAGSAQTLLEDEALRVRKLVEQQTTMAKDAMNGLFKEFEELFVSKSGQMQSLSAREAQTLKGEIMAVREVAKTALAEQSEEAQSLINEATQAVTEASARLATMFERLVKASETSNAAFESTSSKVENHLKTLPGLAEETTQRIRIVLDEELNAFANLAEESSRKIRSLNQAYARHVPGAPRPGVPSPGAWPERPEPNAGYTSDQRPLSIAAQSEAPPRGKGDWAWGEVFAAVDRPFDAPTGDDNRIAPRKSQRPLPSDAEAFSRSSLQIFEALQAMAVDLDRAIETDPPRDLLRRYLNGERETFTKRLKEISSEDTANTIHDRYLEDPEFRDHVNKYIEQFEGLLNEAMSNDQEELLIETFMSSNTGKVYFLLGGAIGHFG